MPAVIGVGALGGAHRLRRFKNVQELEPIAPLLKDLNELVEKIERSQQASPGGSDHALCYHCVGDVCNFLFLVDDSALVIGDSDRKRLNNLVRRLNDRFVNTTPDLLARICRQGAVMAVAGGRHKAPAIAKVLDDGVKPVTHLVTDHLTAQALINRDMRPVA